MHKSRWLYRLTWSAPPDGILHFPHEGWQVEETGLVPMGCED